MVDWIPPECIGLMTSRKTRHQAGPVLLDIVMLWGLDLRGMGTRQQKLRVRVGTSACSIFANILGMLP